MPRARADMCVDRLLQQDAPLREVPLECIGIAQGRRNLSQLVPVAGGTTEGQARLQHPDSVRQVPLGEVHYAKQRVGLDRCNPPACQRGEAERLLPVAPAFGEGPERTQGQRQIRLRQDLHICPGRARRPVRRLYVLPQQRDRPATVAHGIGCLPKGKGGLRLQGAVAERGREREGLLAHRHGAIVVSRYPEYIGHPGQHPS